LFYGDFLGVCGGEVYVVSNNSTFIKQQSGGTIYGSNESDGSLKNTATSGDSHGHVVYVILAGDFVSYPIKKRDTTAGVGVTLDSTKDRAAGRRPKTNTP
jgi:hypothetical protein